MIEIAELGKVAAETVEKTGELAAKSAEKIGETAEISEAALKDAAETGPIVLKPDLETIKGMPLSALMENNMGNVESITSKVEDVANTIENVKSELTEEQKALIIKETGWSPEIVNAIENMDQYEIYKNADLHEVEINGRKCLVKDIDMDYIDPKSGLTNRELMEKGKTPYDAKTGEKIELHHMGQNFDSPFAELCENSEHGDGNDGILHDKKVESWRQDPEKKNQYNNVEKPNHWKTRAKEA